MIGLDFCLVAALTMRECERGRARLRSLKGIEGAHGFAAPLDTLARRVGMLELTLIDTNEVMLELIRRMERWEKFDAGLGAIFKDIAGDLSAINAIKPDIH